MHGPNAHSEPRERQTLARLLPAFTRSPAPACSPASLSAGDAHGWASKVERSEGIALQLRLAFGSHALHRASQWARKRRSRAFGMRAPARHE